MVGVRDAVVAPATGSVACDVAQRFRLAATITAPPGTAVAYHWEPRGQVQPPTGTMRVSSDDARERAVVAAATRVVGARPKGAFTLVIDAPKRQTHKLAYELTCRAAAR